MKGIGSESEVYQRMWGGLPKEEEQGMSDFDYSQISPRIEKIARALCLLRGYNPEQLEPGNAPYDGIFEVIDTTLPNGDSAHFLWRNFVNDAIKLEDWLEEEFR